ncbi:cysteine alpha-hairpin motif superfamily [Kalaharituber pfeilii]|nr:cysteine alpha-hairpin motif superfamily [Kalaharituber pfeilii]
MSSASASTVTSTQTATRINYKPPKYEENPVDDEVKSKFRRKGPSEYYDPCQEAASRSIRCLNRNGGDREMCSDYFQAYRDCKKKWIEERKEDRKKGTGFFQAVDRRINGS